MQYFAALQHDWAADETNGEDLEEIDAGSRFVIGGIIPLATAIGMAYARLEEGRVPCEG